MNLSKKKQHNLCRKRSHIHWDHSHCELILLERTYNPVNRWDLRCVPHRTHIRWLNVDQAQLIWDMVTHRQIHTPKADW